VLQGSTEPGSRGIKRCYLARLPIEPLEPSHALWKNKVRDRENILCIWWLLAISALKSKIAWSMSFIAQAILVDNNSRMSLKRVEYFPAEFHL